MFQAKKASNVPLLVLLFAAGVLRSFAGSVPAGKPEDVGMSSERLQRIHEEMQRHIEAREISGAVTLVARRGRIAHFEAHGLMDIESRKPMAKDAIFRLASMTKPVTAVAVMMLVEQGKVRLNDPVSRFIPEFKDTKVAMPRPGGARHGPAGSLPDPREPRDYRPRSADPHLRANEQRNRAD